MATCKKRGCHDSVRSLGLCSKHYKQQWERQRQNVPPCSFDSCDKPQHANGWCQAHNLRWYRQHHKTSTRPYVYCLIKGCLEIHDLTHLKYPGPDPVVRCPIIEKGEQCPNMTYRKGLCVRHYQLQQHNRYYGRWYMMMQRCYNPENREYHNYGERGITVHPRWHKFPIFRAYLDDVLGEPPEGWSMDRIDCDGNYEPGNLRWADAKTQTNNRRISVKVGSRWTDPDEHHQCSVCRVVFPSLNAFDKHRRDCKKSA